MTVLRDFWLIFRTIGLLYYQTYDWTSGLLDFRTSSSSSGLLPVLPDFSQNFTIYKNSSYKPQTLPCPSRSAATTP
jgi:hypothetical protein